MSSTLNPEQQIVSSLMERLNPLCDQVLLGYAGAELDNDLRVFAILE